MNRKRLPKPMEAAFFGLSNGCAYNLTINLIIFLDPFLTHGGGVYLKSSDLCRVFSDYSTGFSMLAIPPLRKTAVLSIVRERLYAGNATPFC